jgi:serine/threonine protein kinase
VNSSRSQTNGIEFINWFLNFKKLDLNWALENEEEFKEWRDDYRHFGTCQECNQPNTSSEGYNRGWCQSCNAKHFQQGFGKWTSGNAQIDKFIQQCQLDATSAWNVLEWIPYEKFSDIEHVADGGFGKVYRAEWKKGFIERWDNWRREWGRSRDLYSEEYGTETVALKTLSNSQNLNQDFLKELTLYKMFRSSVSNMVPCYGVSKDKEGNYIMVMEYMWEGNLRDYLRKNYRELKFYDGVDRNDKLNFLKQIIQGLKDIHRKKLFHRDFHSGNIIVGKSTYKDKCHITDLGLSKPADETDDNKVFGVMPYVAPEVLRNQPYTPASDIYSLGIIMYEITTGMPPYAEQAHDENLALKICQGARPSFSNPKTTQQVKYPQLLVDLIKKCWDKEPKNRPTTREMSSIVGEWFEEKKDFYGRVTLELKENTEFYHQYQAAEAFNKTLPDEVRYHPTHQSPSGVVWSSKPINTQQINDLLKNLQLTEATSSQLNKINDQMKEIEEKIKALKKTLGSELVELADKFITAYKKMLINEEDEQAMEEVGELEKKLKEREFSQEKIDEVIRCCEELVELEKQELQAKVEINTNK